MLFDPQQRLHGNTVDFCQFQDFRPSGQFASAFPIHQGGARNPAPLGNRFLGQFLFLAQKMQPGAIGIAASFWFSTHVVASISMGTELPSFLTIPGTIHSLSISPANSGAAYFLLPNGAVLVDPGNDQVLSPKLLTGQLATSDALNSALAAEVSSVANLITQSQAQSQAAQFGGRTTMGFGQDVPSLPGGDSGGGGAFTNGFAGYTIDTNNLYLLLTNVANGLAYCGLGCATDQVYAVLASSSLSIPMNMWTVVAEVWPTDTNCMPFTVPIQNQDTLFLSAVDWTGVTYNGNQTPLWWLWACYGDAGLTMADSDSDGSGAHTLLYDYQNGLDPNVIQFSVWFPQRYLNQSTAIGCVTLLAGVPSFYAVLVNGQTATNWLPFACTNLAVTLGSTDGVYTVQVGLRSLLPNAPPSWQSVQLTRDTVAPVIVITNPATGLVTVPMIQLQGYTTKPVSALSYDISNALGCWPINPAWCANNSTIRFCTPSPPTGFSVMIWT